MVRTRLIKPGGRAVEALCPVCQHLRSIYSNEARGTIHCIYCGADFEWEENVPAEHYPPTRTGTEWFSGIASASVPS